MKENTINLPVTCKLPLDNFIVAFNFMSINDSHEFQLFIEIELISGIELFVYKSRSDYYSIADLERLSKYLEAHLLRIHNGQYGSAGYGFVLYQVAFIINALHADVVGDISNYDTEIFIDISKTVDEPRLLVGIRDTVSTADVSRFLQEYNLIIHS